MIDHDVVDADDGRDAIRRCRGDRGTSYILAMVALFLTTGVAAIWLARDVNQRVSDRSALQSIAFQAARTGAQQVDVGALRAGGVLVIDETRAASSALTTAGRLADSYEVDAVVVEQGYGTDPGTWRVTVGLRVGVDATGEVEYGTVVTGVAHAEAGG